MKNLKSVIVECRAYIDTVADFFVETTGRLEDTPDVVTQFIENKSVKMLLKEFLFEFEKESFKSDYDLMQFVKARSRYFEDMQANTMNRLNKVIGSTNGEQRTQYKDQQKRFIDYFFHNYNLLDLITARLTDSPLPKHLQFVAATKLEIRPFPELLTDNYSKDDLDRLLIHLRMKDSKGNNIWPQKMKSALYGIIKALDIKNYLIKTTQQERMASLSIYLGLKLTRVKEGYSKVQTETKEKAISFLNQVVKPVK